MVGLAGISWDRQKQPAWGRYYQVEQGRDKCPGFCPPPAFQSPAVLPLANLPGSQLTREIYFPEMQSRIEEEDLRANRQIIRTGDKF